MSVCRNAPIFMASMCSARSPPVAVARESVDDHGEVSGEVVAVDISPAHPHVDSTCYRSCCAQRAEDSMRPDSA